MAFEIANRIVSGRKAVTNHGTAEKLMATATHCFLILLSADLGNTNPVVIGGAEVVAASGSQQGFVLIPGNSPIAIWVDDVSKVYVDSITDGDAVVFTYFVQ